MENDDKLNNKNNDEKKPEIKEVEDIDVENIKEKGEKVGKTIGTIGNFVLLVFVVLIVGTGILVYYLVNNARDNLEKSVNNLTENNIALNIVKKDDEPEPATIANIIDSVVNTIGTTDDQTTESGSTNTVANTVNSSDVKSLNENIIVLYNGLVLDISKMGVTDLKYIDKKDPNKDKYVITYYNYENFSYKSSVLGTLSEEVYEGVHKIDNVGKIAISEKFNCIPREVQVVNTLPSAIVDNNPKIQDYDTVKTIIIDLDGNGANESIVIMANKKTGFSKISLFDYQGSKIADLASIEKSKWETASTEEYYLSISNVEVLDIDNDGVMEILIELPVYEGQPSISLLKYKNGELQGEKDYECSLLP